MLHSSQHVRSDSYLNNIQRILQVNWSFARQILTLEDPCFICFFEISILALFCFFENEWVDPFDFF